MPHTHFQLEVDLHYFSLWTVLFSPVEIAHTVSTSDVLPDCTLVGYFLCKKLHLDQLLLKIMP